MNVNSPPARIRDLIVADLELNAALLTPKQLRLHQPLRLDTGREPTPVIESRCGRPLDESGRGLSRYSAPHAQPTLVGTVVQV